MIVPIRFPNGPPSVKRLLQIYAVFGILFGVIPALFLLLAWLFLP